MADIASRVKGVAKLLQNRGDTLDGAFTLQHPGGTRRRIALSRGRWFWTLGLAMGSSNSSLRAMERAHSN